MSRTYRTRPDWRPWCGCDASVYRHGRCPHEHQPGAWSIWYINCRARDRKAYEKAPKWFKRMKGQIFRARVRDAMHKGRELPRLRRTNDWEWT